MPKLTVVVPSYNSSKYLNKCIDSLLNQTLKDIEIILINDGSTDDTSKIINSYKDDRIVYIKNSKNKGIGYSRNKGIKESHSKYICFVDSDDYVKENFCEILYSKIKTDDNDMVVCNYYNVNNNEEVSENIEFKDNTNLKETPEILMNINLSPWNKIYKKSLLINNNIQFPEDLKYEDVPFVIKCLNKSKSIGYIKEDLYYYIIHSMSQQTVVNDKVFDILKVLKLVIEELNNFNNEIKDEFICREISRYTIKQRCNKDKKSRNKFINDAFTFLKKSVPHYKNNEYYKKRKVYQRIIEKNKMLTKIYCGLYVACK